MTRASLPPNEIQRLEALKSYDILDSQSEQAFDDLTAIASLVCGAPISLISLLDDRRQWFKSKVGLETSETPREQAFCGYTILGNELFVIPDATQDIRTSSNPLVVGEPQIRFYAGAPLITSDGFALGSLCVIDRTPRSLDSQQLDILTRLSRQVVYLMELRRASQSLFKALDEIQNYKKIVPICSFCKSVRTENGTWLGWNEFMEGKTQDLSHGICPTCFKSEYSEM